MKTAISIPDETFRRASTAAEELGISRSAFFATAAKRYLEELETDSLVGEINKAVDMIGKDDSTRIAVEAGRRLLTRGDDW